MRTSKHLVRSLLLMALALGMNLLSYADMTHGRMAPHRSRLSYSHLPPHGSHRPTGRSGRTLRMAAADNHSADQTEASVAAKLKPIDPTVALPAAAILQQKGLFPPQMTASPLAQVNVISIGSAPRAPGSARAPPIA